MHFKLSHNILLGLMLLLSSFSLQTTKKLVNPRVELKTMQTHYEAGSSIVLKFSFEGPSLPLLYCSSSYGSTLISAKEEKSELHFTIPTYMSNKSGLINWELNLETEAIKGQLTIEPKKETHTLETYIGPPSIIAGGSDYTMLVVIPTDSLDNPLPKQTKVTAKHRFLKSQVEDSVFTTNTIAFKTIYSPLKSGRLLISTESLNTASKEFTVDVFPATPANFKISAERVHDYADGNQITTFKTSTIRDALNNVVSDGTYVSFLITNEEGQHIKTFGTTINGIAKGQMIHPDKNSVWTIKAYIEGMAESDSISIEYKQAITEFDVSFSEHNRQVSIGPLHSFMQQLIPDGHKVTLTIHKEGKMQENITETSVNGMVTFELEPHKFPEDIYTITISTSGLERHYKSVKLW